MTDRTARDADPAGSRAETRPGGETRAVGGVEVDVLGPMRLRVDGVEVGVPGARRRALLAVLALARSRVVAAGALITAIWGDDPPVSAEQTLHSHLSRLRGHLGPRAGHLVRDGAGYRLRLAENGLDASRAEALAAHARALRPTDPSGTAATLRQALDLWQGDALAEFGEIGPLGAEAVRLARLRQVLTDELLDARLACEPAAVVVGDAARAAAADPCHEAAHLLLIRALALDGRAPEALATARDFRRRLADQTGLTASAALAELEHAVARGGLTAPVPVLPPTAPAPAPSTEPPTAAPEAPAALSPVRPPRPKQPAHLARMAHLPRPTPPARSASPAPTRPTKATDSRPQEPGDELTDAPAPATSLPRQPPVRVPRSPTPLLGRADELERLTELLRADRCVTVVGPGGVGKTRLMLDVVRGAAPRWPDGATLVELAPVRDQAAVPFVFAQALAVSTRGDLIQTIIDFLATRRQLLVIDNCEHLLDSVRELVDELLRWVPGLAVLATSRAPLDAAGEWVFRLGPLPLPAPETDPRAAPAVRLFLDRARQARGGAELAATAFDDAVEICRGLDGLPLAIELAASRLTLLSPADLRARMDTRLDLGRPRAGQADDQRHQTLRDTIAWSYRLLDPPAQRLFRHLAAVPGVFDLDIAEFVAGALTHPDPPGTDPPRPPGTPGTPGTPDPRHPRDPLAALSVLVDASMVETVAAPAGPDGGTGFRMLDSIRAFGLEAARAAGDLGAAQDLIATWAEAFGLAAAEGLTGAEESRWVRRVVAALPVLRAGRERMLERGDVAAIARLCVGLEEYAVWYDNAELWSWALHGAELPGVADLPEAALLFATASHSAWRLGSINQAVELARRALASATDELGVSVARYALGTVALFTGDFAAAVDDLAACAEVETRRVPNQLAVAALAAGYGGQRARADELIARADQLIGPTSSAVTRSFVAYVQAEICAHTDPAAARRHAERALTTARAGGISFIAGIALVTLASSAVRSGDLTTAATCYPEAIRQWLRTGSWPQQWTTLRNTADLFARLGREADALLVLTAAAVDEDAPTLVGGDAEQLAALVTRLRDTLGEAAAERVQREASQLTRVEVVERALAALAGVVG